MKVNEIKETKEVVVRTEYVAEDGSIFSTEDECRKYEESAYFVIDKKLKRLNGNTSQNELIEEFSYDNRLEIFDIQTQEDLDNLRRYLYIKLSMAGYSDDHIKGCFESTTEDRVDYVFDGVTYGHEVMIFWNYDEDWFWVFKDGSLSGLYEYIKERYEKIINKENKQ